MSNRSLPGCGIDGGRGHCGIIAPFAAPERAAAEPYLLTLYAWLLCAQVSPLPGGYKRGEKVLFMGSNRTTSCGDKLVHGQQGEVMRAATSEQAKGKGLAVRFPGNKGWFECYLSQVRRRRAASFAPPSCAIHATLHA